MKKVLEQYGEASKVKLYRKKKEKRRWGKENEGKGDIEGPQTRSQQLGTYRDE